MTKTGRVHDHYYFMPHVGTGEPTHGPYESARDLCHDLHLTEYPSDGMIVTWDSIYGVWGGVPSINPNDLVWAPIINEDGHQEFVFLVTIKTDTLGHADEVMAERLGHDEDYGFDYQVDWR